MDFGLSKSKCFKSSIFAKWVCGGVMVKDVTVHNEYASKQVLWC
jgi:hypothetical protein